MTDRTFAAAYVPLKKGLDSPFSQGRTYRDQIYRHMPEADWNGEWLESTDLPIRVLWTGSSIWLPGDFWERRGSNHLGIEFVTRGQLLFQAQGKEWTAEKGDVCIRFMINNIQTPMTNAAMASAAGVSISHLSLLFRETIGCAPMQYCTDRKMAAARHLLSQSEKSIKEIAQMVGYKDQLYFSKCFHHHSGLSPREFRQGARRYRPVQD